MTTSESFETARPVITSREAADAITEGVKAAGVNGTHPVPPAARTLPHSPEAEEYLLANCLLDEGDTLSRAIGDGIAPDSFYNPNHAIIFATLRRMQRGKIPIGASTLVGELTASRELDSVGGYRFIAQITNSVPTTAQATYFIAKVREQATLREIIRTATGAVEDCYGFSGGGIESFRDSLRTKFEPVFNTPLGTVSSRMGWDELMAFNPKSDPDCLMGNRFLGRTAAMVIVAPSGVGKSVLGFQLGACAALQRHFFSLKMHTAMRVLYIQAEDDFGDVAESVQGFMKGYNVTPDELLQLKARFRIERWNDVSGGAFLARLRHYHTTWPFDFVIINPLFSFAGCNLSEQREISPFLRNGLNPILNETRSAAAIIHHTNKPPQDVSAQDSATNAELRYLGSGSAELTNWARAYITLQGVRAAGDHIHKMVFVKRGNRAGLINDKGEHTNSVFIQHSTTGLCWLPSDYTPESTGGKFTPVFNLAKALTIFDSAKPWGQNEILIARDQSMSVRAVRYHRREIEENGL